MKKIQLTKEMIKRLENETYYTKEYFIQDCKDYIKAIKEGRMLYLVDTVSNSGMSRTLIIKSCEKNKINWTMGSTYTILKIFKYF